MATMRDVAELAGVSLKTVSRVFNDDPHVLPETRARVEAALRELDYIPNTLATTFRAGRAPIVGLVVPDLVDPYFASIAKAVGTVAAAHGMSVSVTSIGTDAHREPEIVTAALGQSLSGLILAPVTTEQSYLRPWSGRTPIVFVDRSPAKFTADSFTQDDHGGAFAATAHLIGHGHRRIAFAGDALTKPTVRRLEGYHAALEQHGIDGDGDLVVLDVWDRPSAAEAVTGLRTLADPPTAVFSSNDRASMALFPAVRGTGLALLSFGDFPMADLLEPAVTVVDQDPGTLGALAAERIFDRLAHPARRFRRRTVVPVSLVERESCRRTADD
ncbi:LacI family transcriptional regulator [Amycolatopsis bartoniae]|uniref:LacI family transcriptional regulator n=1 Tax=Amycolatopsis bartoniae TaxID=941986 RepID=A0A8H9IXU3_9PSEU|nr:LacI family DNA-binding transcriptional regulator [Amycolatopsis bartoniae]MBB2939802.1 LacI family transcriptional regulator [Amycolatopsis bartoniae]TVT07489.1 LacI family transcriptional regulator [Amycolatopsis bartoniae]GHF54614.1 LacI family transcriptional regulator [Amycolatopsis bartoniae]